jgi:hypothetical protein
MWTGSAVVIVGLAFAPWAQSDRVPPPKDMHEAVVQGCLRGGSLKVTRSDTGGDQPETFHLRIPKGIAKALKEYEGHEVELTGFVKDTDRTMGAGKSKALSNNTKITVGAREDHDPGDLPPQRDLQVASFRDVAPVCHR